MPTSMSEKVLSHFETLLAGITVSNGYETDIGQRVFRARRRLDPEDLPCLVFWDGGEDPQADDRGDTNTGGRSAMVLEQRIVVQAYVLANQAQTGTQLGKAKADIKKRICGSAQRGVFVNGEGKAQGILAYLGATPSPRDDGDASEGVEITFAVTYPERYGDPYA
jgi:hypothetical protein